MDQKYRLTAAALFWTALMMAPTKCSQGNADVSELRQKKPYIAVDKSDGVLHWVREDGTESYTVGTGMQNGEKQRHGDNKTPEGEYRVCAKYPSGKYKYFIALNYPNKVDAERGLRNGQISKAQYDDIIGALTAGRCPPWNTSLGGAIGIHGELEWKIDKDHEIRIGPLSYLLDLTRGCIATTDENAEELYRRIPVGTRVIIQP